MALEMPMSNSSMMSESQLGLYLCDDCPFLSPSKTAAARHSGQTGHNRDRYCGLCRRIFQNPGALQRHEQTSLGHSNDLGNLDRQHPQPLVQGKPRNRRRTKTPGGTKAGLAAAETHPGHRQSSMEPHRETRQLRLKSVVTQDGSRHSYSENRLGRQTDVTAVKEISVREDKYLPLPIRLRNNPTLATPTDHLITMNASTESKLEVPAAAMNAPEDETRPKKKQKNDGGDDDEQKKPPIVYPVSPVVYPTIQVVTTGHLPHGNNNYTLYSRESDDVLFEALQLRCHSRYRLSSRKFVLPGSLTEAGYQLPKTIVKSEFEESPAPCPLSLKRRVVALDCEMVGVLDLEKQKEAAQKSQKGQKEQKGQNNQRNNRSETFERSELAELVVIDVLTGETLINNLVSQRERIVNWRTRYSGVTAARMSVARMNGLLLHGWRAARAELFKYIDADTIIIGHDVQNDLNVLRLVHGKIIDTSIQTSEAVFGDPMRLPRAYNLKDLARDLLRCNIQVGKKGHDCVEDTLATREIALWCICSADKLAVWAEKMRVEFEKARVAAEKKREEDRKKQQAAAEEKRKKEAEAKGNKYKEHCCVELPSDWEDDD